MMFVAIRCAALYIFANVTTLTTWSSRKQMTGLLTWNSDAWLPWPNKHLKASFQHACHVARSLVNTWRHVQLQSDGIRPIPTSNENHLTWYRGREHAWWTYAWDIWYDELWTSTVDCSILEETAHVDNVNCGCVNVRNLSTMRSMKGFQICRSGVTYEWWIKGYLSPYMHIHVYYCYGIDAWGCWFPISARVMIADTTNKSNSWRR